MVQRILHVEDNPDDVLLIGLAFRKAGVPAKLEVATDGDKAIALLSKGGAEAAPACVLLDIKLPTISGLEVLAWIRKQPHLKRLPECCRNHPGRDCFVAGFGERHFIALNDSGPHLAG